ncbi:MAG: hypothetical protein NTV80_04255, partial [Verrucomicrobia bacterium]|nr:hypothetical protein [Verrucomicrobiota bacterium]
MSWVDAEAWAELPGFLDACGKNVKASTAELRLLAEVWDRLGNDEKAALTMLKAAEMAGSEGALWLAAAKMHARTQKFSEARKSLAKMGDNAAVELVAVAMKLSWQMAQTEGQTETVLPVLKKQAEARPTDTALLLMVMEWEVEHGRNTDATISKLREQVSAAKSPELRLPWRRLLVTALSRQGKLNEAPEEAEAWLIESKQGSAEERTAMTALLRSLERESTGRGSKPAEPLKQLAGRLVSRLAVFQTLLTWLADRGQAAEALALLDQYPEISADDLRVELLTLTDRHAEAAALLQRKGDAHSRLCAALLQRDLGERELAARGLESWAARGEAQRSEVESIVPVLSLLRNQSEMQEWRQNAARRFPESHIFSART